MITERDAREWPAPNRVPAGPDSGTTVVLWDTDDRSVGEIYVSVNYADERLFFRASQGSQPAPWINEWGTYEGRRYGDSRPSGLFATVTVTRNKG
jgi:hypothetical protein